MMAPTSTTGIMIPHKMMPRAANHSANRIIQLPLTLPGSAHPITGCKAAARAFARARKTTGTSSRVHLPARFALQVSDLKDIVRHFALCLWYHDHLAMDKEPYRVGFVKSRVPLFLKSGTELKLKFQKFQRISYFFKFCKLPKLQVDAHIKIQERKPSTGNYTVLNTGSCKSIHYQL